MNFVRATRRAKVRSRRYIVANRLRYMWVLTRAGGHGLHGVEGRVEIMRLAAALVVGVRTQLGGEALPYWYSPELHPAGKPGGSREICPDPEGCGCGGHGWHLNLFVAKPIPLERVMKRMWLGLSGGNGYEVRYKDWTKDDRLEGMPFAEKLRAGARYGTKYATKDWSESVLVNRAHRYEVGQGFEPPSHQVIVTSREQAEELLREIGRLTAVRPTWCSADIEGWPGPECWGYEWSPPVRGGP
jgi:hypothetical protein